MAKKLIRLLVYLINSSLITHKMEFLYNHTYLITFFTNVSDFRINVYNQKNNKKYELVEHALVEKYKDVGIDIFEVITECLNSDSYELNDMDTSINIAFEYGSIIKLTIVVPNILCEYKDASLLDLKTENIRMKDEIKELKCTIDDMKRDISYLLEQVDEINLGDYVKVPKMVKKLVVCKTVVNTCYYDIFGWTDIQYYNYTSSRRTTTNSDIFHSSYSGFKTSQFVKPSKYEFYNDPNTPYLCFKDILDCSKLKDVELDQLGLFNIKLKNFSKINRVKNIYLWDVTFEDDQDYLSEELNLSVLGFRSGNMSKMMVDSINLKATMGRLERMLIPDTHPSKKDLRLSMMIVVP